MEAAHTPPVVGSQPSASGVGRTVSALLAVLAIVAGTVASLGVWAQAVLLDADGSTDVVSRIVDSPNVVAGLGKHLGDELVRLYDENLSFANRVPDALKDQAVSLDLTIAEEIRERSVSVAGSEPVKAAVAAAAVDAHAALANALTHNTTGDPDSVRLNLVPAATALFRSLQDEGAWPSSPAVPEIDVSSTPDAQADALETALGFDLPDGLSEVRLFDSDTARSDLAEAREIVSSARVVTWVALVLFAAMTLISAVRARGWSRRVNTVGAIVAGTAVSVWIVARQAPGRISAGVDDEMWARAVGDTVATLLSSLVTWSLVSLSVALTAVALSVAIRRQRNRSVGASAGNT